MRVAREGIPFIIIGAILAGGAIAFAAAWGGIVWWALAGLLTLVALWVVYFFRDPERNGERGDRLVISPADGRVIDIREVDEPAYLGGRAIRISVFMNVFNVHVQRAPVNGKIVFYEDIYREFKDIKI